MKVGRNDPCPCGSGKKYKKCCMTKDGEELAAENVMPENINTLMLKGYDYANRKQMIEACELWWQAWEETLTWLDSKPSTSISNVNALTGDNVDQSFSNWVQDFEIALERVGSDNEKYLQMRIDFPTQYRKRFPDSDPTIMLNMGTAVGESLMHLGRKDEGDAQFEKVASEHPNDPWPLIRWGDMYTSWMNQKLADHDRARRLYEKASKIATTSYDKEAVQERIEDLNK